MTNSGLSPNGHQETVKDRLVRVLPESKKWTVSQLAEAIDFNPSRHSVLIGHLKQLQKINAIRLVKLTQTKYEITPINEKLKELGGIS